MIFDLDMIKKVYERYPERVAAARNLLNKPLTLSEKILYTHLNPESTLKNYSRGKDYVFFSPEREKRVFFAHKRKGRFKKTRSCFHISPH